MCNNLCPDQEKFLDFFNKKIEIEESTQCMSLKPKKTAKPAQKRLFIQKPAISNSFNICVQLWRRQICESHDQTRAWKSPKLLNGTLIHCRSLCHRFCVLTVLVSVIRGEEMLLKFTLSTLSRKAPFLQCSSMSIHRGYTIG